MGCGNCRDQLDMTGFDLTSIDYKVYQSEQMHPFSQIPLRSLYREFLLNDRQGKIPIQNFLRACDHLEITSRVIYSYTEFLGALKLGLDAYSTEKLILSIILLGKARLSQKLQLLFEFYDTHAFNRLSRPILVKMIDGLLVTSAHVLPLISCRMCDLPDIIKYKESLTGGIEVLTSKCVDAILNSAESITCDGFYFAITEDARLQNIFNPETARAILKKEANEVPRNHKIDTLTKESIPTAHPMSIRQDSTAQFANTFEVGNICNSELSNESSDAIIIQVKMQNRNENFIMYPDENADEAVNDFSSSHLLRTEEKERLLSSVRQIQEHINSKINIHYSR